MSQFTPFSSGFELSPLVKSSGLLCKSWNAIISSSNASNMGDGVSWKVHRESDNDLTIIAFEATPPVSNLQPDLLASSALKERNFLHFEFLCTKKYPQFHVNKDAANLFYENHQKLDQLKSQNTSSTPMIVTGQGLGGSVAVLFTLSLLDNIGSGKNRLLCITFGSPLIGDKNLQRAVSRSSRWNSCFLQVVSHKDPLPRLFIRDHTPPSARMSPHPTDYMPFGTFLFCSGENSTCFENPQSILELLKRSVASVQGQNQGFQSADYGDIVENLCSKAICKDLTAQGVDMAGYSSLQASISLQLWALGLTPHMQQQQQQNSTFLTTMESLEKYFNSQKGNKFEPTTKLNIMKTNMAQLEWYRKISKNRNIGYFDSYKNMSSKVDQDVVTFHKSLSQYWKNMVEEAEMKPQKEGANFRVRWLYAGTNYRRMVEPLDIAEYYRDGGKDYVNKGRSKHYKKLEEWLREGATATSSSNSTSKKDVESILTFDSCFWAQVEEALLSCKVVRDAQASVTQKEEAKRKLIGFEEYVYGLLKNSEVSSEIFLRESGYMIWWGEYMEIDGAPYHSELARFMSNADNYNVQYVRGTYNFR